MAAWLDVSGNGAKFVAYYAVPTPVTGVNWLCGDVRRISTFVQYSTFRFVNTDTAPATFALRFLDPKTGTVKLSKSYALGGGKQLSVTTSPTGFGSLGYDYQGLAHIQVTSGKGLVVTASNSHAGGGATGYTCLAAP